MTSLSNLTLKIVAETVAVPNYDRALVQPGVMHFGVGNFHRAHQAMYLDDLMNRGRALDWGICGVGVMASDARMRDVMAAQDGLYTLTLRHADGRLEPRVIGSIVKYLFAPDDPEAVIHQLVDPVTRIVSLTITEGGYNTHPVTGEFNLANKVVVDDSRSVTPATVFGLVVEGLRRRRAAGVAPFTIMSCDNIPGNGNVAKASFVAFAQINDRDLARWIESEVSFPNSMVDRITPATMDADRTTISERFFIEDEWPVLSEPFKQWVVEDSFALGRPSVELAGVQVVDDVLPYELMKLRLLNVGHQAIAYFGFLAGYRFVHEAMGDGAIRGFLRSYMREEGVPTLPPVPGIDIDAYISQIIERFSNPEVRDTIARLCADTSNRIPKWLVPVIQQNLADGGSVSFSAAIVASWARYAEGLDENGEPIDIADPIARTLVDRARSHIQDDLCFLRDSNLFGFLASDDRFTDEYRKTLRMLHEVGSLATLRKLIADVESDENPDKKAAPGVQGLLSD